MDEWIPSYPQYAASPTCYDVVVQTTPSREAVKQGFDGFERPNQNWFRLPKTWTSVTRSITSIAELKVVEYVLQHTWSQHEHGASKRISTNEFRFGIRSNDRKRVDQGTGLSKQTIITGLKKAVKRGLLIETVDARDKGRVHKSYRLRMKGDSDIADEPIMERSDHILDSDVKLLDPVKDLDTRGLESGHRTENGIGIGSQEKRLPVTVSHVAQNNPNQTVSSEPTTSQTSPSPVGNNSPLKKLPDNSMSPSQLDQLVDTMIEKFRDVESKAY